MTRSLEGPFCGAFGNFEKLTISQDFTQDKEIHFFLPNCLTRSIGSGVSAQRGAVHTVKPTKRRSNIPQAMHC